MRKIIVISMMSIDGVIQGPGARGEDRSGGFRYSGWEAPYVDEQYMKPALQQMKASDLLLGRKTFEIFEEYWPKHAEQWPGIMAVTKYAVSRERKSSPWENSVFLRGVADIKKLKRTKGSDLKVWGSADLVQTLLKHDLVDELWLNIFPLTLGKGKRLFSGGAIPAAFTMTKGTITPSGIIVANYTRAGKVRTGTIGA